MKRPFPIDPALVAIAVAYRNTSLIADDVMPRTTVGAKEYKYLEYNKADRFTLPDTRVGRKGRPNQVEFGSTEKTGLCVDYGLEDIIPNDDKEAANMGNNPRGEAVEGIMDLVSLDREKRVADKIMTAANYAGNSTVISGTDQWTDTANSTPVDQILQYLDEPLMRPNAMVLGHSEWLALRRHPQVAKTLHGNSGDEAIATRRAIAEMFELENVFVGQSRLNSANPGQAMSLQRVWAGGCALLYINRAATTQRGVTFGFTAQNGSRVAGSYNDDSIGLKGAEVVKAGEVLDEKIVAPDCGYFLQNVI